MRYSGLLHKALLNIQGCDPGCPCICSAKSCITTELHTRHTMQCVAHSVTTFSDFVLAVSSLLQGSFIQSVATVSKYTLAVSHVLQGRFTLVAGSTEMQLKQPEFPQHGEPPATVTCCSSLLTSTDRYISKTNIYQWYFTEDCLGEWKPMQCIQCCMLLSQVVRISCVYCSAADLSLISAGSQEAFSQEGAYKQ